MTTGLTMVSSFGWDVVAGQMNTFGEAIDKWFCNILKVLDGTYIESVPDTLMKSIKAVSITLVVLFFLIDFFNKTMHLQWVTWENVLMLFIKLIIAKICVDNADQIMQMIFSGLNSLTSSIDNLGTIFSDGIAGSGISIGDVRGGVDLDKQLAFFGLDKTEIYKDTPNTFVTKDYSWLKSPMEAAMVQIKMNIVFIIALITIAVANVIVIARMFELAIYTAVAPLALSTLACDGLTDVGKGFLKSYAAVCLQGLVLIIMFAIYSNIMASDFVKGLPYSGLISCLALALGVMQSGAWAKRICGAM